MTLARDVELPGFVGPGSDDNTDADPAEVRYHRYNEVRERLRTLLRLQSDSPLIREVLEVEKRQLAEGQRPQGLVAELDDRWRLLTRQVVNVHAAEQAALFGSINEFEEGFRRDLDDDAATLAQGDEEIFEKNLMALMNRYCVQRLGEIL